MFDKDGHMSDSTERFVGIDVSKGALELFADPAAPQREGPDRRVDENPHGDSDRRVRLESRRRSAL